MQPLGIHSHANLAWLLVLCHRLWKDVTYALKMRDVDKATEFKHSLEQRQREEAKVRKDTGTVWKNKVCICLRVIIRDSQNLFLQLRY